MIFSTTQLIMACAMFFFAGLGFLFFLMWSIHVVQLLLNRNAFPEREKTSQDGYL